MPSLKELMTPKNVGILIYCGVVPIPDGVLEQVENAEKAFERLGLGGTMPERAVRQAPGVPSLLPRGRASINRDIVAFLSTEPLTMRTPRQVWSGIKSAYPKQTSETVQTRLKNNAGKPGMWIAAGGKYGMLGAEAKVSTTKANASTTEVNTNVVPAPGAAPGEKLQPRVYAYIEAYPGYTKAQVIMAFKTSPTPARENHVSIAIGRLRTSKKITDAEDGPYWPLLAAKPTAASGGIGDGAAAAA
jgi:hypothetical protein